MKKLTLLHGRVMPYLIFSFILFAMSCRKDRYSSEVNISQKNNVDDIAIDKWYSDNPISQIIPIDWKKARQAVVDGKHIVRVPTMNIDLMKAGLNAKSTIKSGMLNSKGLVAGNKIALDQNPVVDDGGGSGNTNYFSTHPPEVYFVQDPLTSKMRTFVTNFIPDDQSTGFGQNGNWTGKLFEWNTSSDTVLVQTFVNNVLTDRSVRKFYKVNEDGSIEFSGPQKLQSLTLIKDKQISGIFGWLADKILDGLGAIGSLLGLTELVPSTNSSTGHHYHYRFVSHPGNPSGNEWDDTGVAGNQYVSMGLPLVSSYLSGMGSGTPNVEVTYSSYNYSGVNQGNSGPNNTVPNGDGIFVLEYLTVSADAQNYILTIPGAPLATLLRDYLNANNFSAESRTFASSLLEYYIAPNSNITLEELKIKYGFDPIIVPDNGIEIEDAPENVAIGTYPIIGQNTNRNNTEDMTYGTNHDATGIGSAILARSNEELWSSMRDLMDWGTMSDPPLRQVAYDFVNKFKTNTTTQTEMVDPLLNNRVEISPAFAKFLKLFGERLRTELQKSNGSFSNMATIELDRIRPIFGGSNNMRNGLTILLNDTEQSTIRLESYSRTGNKMNIVVEVTIKDHFGLDKHDAVSKDFFHHGFQSWWVLQHRKGFIPFNTKVTVRKTLIINL